MKNNVKFLDVFGCILLDQLNSQDTIFEIVEREDGYLEPTPVKKAWFSEYNDWPEVEKVAIKYTKGRVLDIGCGAGRQSLYLQKKGFDATGIDISHLAVKVCKLRGLKKVKVLSIEDVDTFKTNSFDTIIMFGNNFGLFSNPAKLKTVLKKFYKILSDDGIIIAETLNPYNTNNPDHIAYHNLNKKRGRMTGQIRMRIRYKRLIGNWFDYLFLSPQELSKMLEGTQWKIKKIITNRHLKGSAQYVAVLEKIK